MGSTKITISVEGGSASDVKAALDDEYELRVRKQPGACERCVMNENGELVPPFGPGLHPHCRCTAVIVKK